jgi:hypothetical protein
MRAAVQVGVVLMLAYSAGRVRWPFRIDYGECTLDRRRFYVHIEVQSMKVNICMRESAALLLV